MYVYLFRCGMTEEEKNLQILNTYHRYELKMKKQGLFEMTWAEYNIVIRQAVLLQQLNPDMLFDDYKNSLITCIQGLSDLFSLLNRDELIIHYDAL